MTLLSTTFNSCIQFAKILWQIIFKRTAAKYMNKLLDGHNGTQQGTEKRQEKA